FKVIKILGQGGFGTVYRVFYSPSNLTCAMKVLDKDYLNRNGLAYQDKMVASVIKSPFLVNYYAAFPGENCYVVMMEELDGIELRKYVDTSGCLNLSETVLISAQFYLAIEHLHLRGFIHRD